MMGHSFSYEQLSGTLVNYYVHCPRQAWLFNEGLHLEDFSDRVRKGKWIDNNTFKRQKEVEILGEHIKADFVLENRTPIEIHEVKSSKVPRYDHKMQLAFYLQKLKEKGIDAVGVLHYPEINSIERINLSDVYDDLTKTIDAIIKAMNDKCPTRLDRKSCKGCSFFEFCYSIEGD